MVSALPFYIFGYLFSLKDYPFFISGVSKMISALTFKLKVFPFFVLAISEMGFAGSFGVNWVRD